MGTRQTGAGNADVPPAILLMGPTASGKTGLAVELVKRFPLEIISVDSALVYRGLDIGTAKPDAAELAVAPHRLIDIREPDEPYSAAEFRADALREMADITHAGRVPLLVGGTMLYFRALVDGLSRLPAADPEVRARLEARAAASGWGAMHAELARVDPQSASRIDPNDPQRIQRALEVLEITGQPMSALQERRQGEPLPFRPLRLVVCPQPRSVLHERIERRLDAMLARGFEQEMRRLHADPRLHPRLPSMRAVGYRQGWQWLEGEFDRSGMRLKILHATRQLAKRQLTWLRRESDGLWYDPTEDEALGGLMRTVERHLED